MGQISTKSQEQSTNVKRLFLILSLLIFVQSICATDYYASTTGSGSTCSLGSPCSLTYALGNQVVFGSGDTIYLRGGTYTGKFTSTLDGGTVRSYCSVLAGGCVANPGEWAIIDGNLATTLNGGINSSVTSITVASTAGMVSAGIIGLDTELMQISSVDSGTTLTVNRNWAPNIGGAAAHSNGVVAQVGGNQLTVSGSNTTYRDFEIMSSWTQRDIEPGAISGEGCCGYYSVLRGTGISTPNGAGNSYINLIIRDNGTGIFTGSSSSDTLIYGVLTYNNGMHYYDNASLYERGSGPGYYLENVSGYSRLYEGLSLNNFMNGAQFFGVTGSYVGGDVQGAIIANAGAPLGNSERNIVYGPDSVVSPTGTVNVSHIYHVGPDSYNVAFGYGAGITTGTFTNNYIGGGQAGFGRQTVTTLTFTGNIIHSTTRNIIAPETGAGTWDNNTYYNTAADAIKFGNETTGNQNFADWKTSSGDDATSTINSGNLPTTYFVRPNSYESGRCNIIIYAIGQTSVNVDFTTCGLANGQTYVIKNAFDWYGGDVATGTYNSGSPTVSVPLNGEADDVAAPIESGDAEVDTPATTCPTFCVLIVLPTSSIKAATSGVVKLGGGARMQ